MTAEAEQKAKELYNKYAVFWHDTPDTCKKQCLIAVDEMEKLHLELLGYMTGIMGGYTERKMTNKYYEDLKQAIQNL